MDQPTFQIKTEEETNNRGVYFIEPLPEGYGNTLGNSIRRVLLTSLSGAAITTVKLSSVKHQFTTLEGMGEDVVEFVLNLKKVRAKYTGDKPVRLSLSKKGPGKVMAGDIECPAGVEIVNKDIVLANLSEGKAKIEAEMTVESGVGYSMADERKSGVIGVIPIDALFSPVTRVNYKVEATRVGRMTNFDRLIMEINTDGSVKPLEALREAAKILQVYYQQIVNPVVPSASVPASTSATTYSSDQEILKMTVDELDLPIRIANALRKAGIETVADLMSTPRAEIAKTKNLGEKSLKVIELSLKDKGIELPS
ncbi:MAG: DNA-directed RNA polymerase subunit alpha [Microgenomates group bacterium GW2011_GWA1_Microgenomates_45_10]|nr:MAG: DNA-directed RNA polymerase subunit alpha [Microgenomates group bacterium GW2011_GWA2_44_7]KKT78093.1 MAG: DNA-directed RNA polymerase subunit alpha [Microgenomates group bacterium GW2011_GWB1_44_8]KKT87430.1 MAG: DNA-directed RNA polymerase subunit alpha [Microgenomates group bacterium GW2011_GWA1_Microgenomates_45_10]